MLDDVVPTKKANPYYQLLAHDPEPLRQRTGLFDGIMQGEGGSPRSDRELAAVAASRVNGCVFCAAVHARAYDQLTSDTDQIQRLLDEGVDTELRPRERAIVDVAVRLTTDPSGFGAADLAPLRALGVSDLEILDITNGAAIFAWANRLLQTLGESVVAEPSGARSNPGDRPQGMAPCSPVVRYPRDRVTTHRSAGHSRPTTCIGDGTMPSYDGPAEIRP